MRILMLDNEFPPLGGGTGVVNYHLLTEMAAYPEVWVDLVTSSRSRSNYEIERFAERITIYKVPVDNHNIHHSSNHELLRYSWRGLLKSYELLRRQPYDLSFAFAGVPAGVISYTLNLMTGLPYLVSLQGPDVPGFEARYNYLYPFLKPLLQRVWRRAALVTAISSEHQRLARQTTPELDIAIIHNGVDIDTFQSVQRSHDQAVVNLVCVGRLIERKGQHHLLRAFAQVQRDCPQQVHLTLVGTGDAEDSFRRLAADLGITGAVTFTGFVSREDMPAVYQQSDIFVLPSQSEGMSIALLEAMASGLPVVVSDTGGTAELVHEDKNGCIVAWADVPALTEALIRLVQDPARRQQMGQRSRQLVGQFSWPAITREYLERCAGMAAQAQPKRASSGRWAAGRLMVSDE